MTPKITYPYSFTDLFYNRDTLRGFQLDSNFNAVTSELSNIEDYISNISETKYSFKSVYSYSIPQGQPFIITTDEANKGYPVTDLYNGLRIKGFFNIWNKYVSDRGKVLKVDNTDAKPLYIKNPNIPNQSSGLVIPANGLSTGFMTFIYDISLDGWLYEGEIPTGTVLFSAIPYSSTDDGSRYKFRNATGYLMLGGVNSYLSTLTKADIEPFGYMLDNNNTPLDTNQLVGAGLSDVYTSEFGLRYLGLSTNTSSLGSLLFCSSRPRNTSTKADWLVSSTGDFTIDNDISGLTSANASNENVISTISLDYTVDSQDEVIRTRHYGGGIWLKL